MRAKATPDPAAANASAAFANSASYAAPPWWRRPTFEGGRGARRLAGSSSAGGRAKEWAAGCRPSLSVLGPPPQPARSALPPREPPAHRPRAWTRRSGHELDARVGLSARGTDRLPAPAQVAKNKIWSEHCIKENGLSVLNTTFAINNTDKMNLLPEKPNYMVPHARMSTDEVEKAKGTIRDVASIKDMDLPPQERFEAPLTSSQEYGWHHKPMVPQNPMFYFTKGGCDITQYADSYVQMKGTTPFSRKMTRSPPAQAQHNPSQQGDR